MKHHRTLTFTLKEDENLCILNFCCWTGDIWNQGISRYSIDPVNPAIHKAHSSPCLWVSKHLTHCGHMASLYESCLTLLQVMAWCLKAPSHYLNQCWCIVNWIPCNKQQWNFNQGTVSDFHTRNWIWKWWPFCFIFNVGTVTYITSASATGVHPTSHEHLRQLHCSFNSLFRVTTKKTSNLCITGPLLGEATIDWILQWLANSTHTVPVVQKAFPHHAVINFKNNFFQVHFTVISSPFWWNEINMHIINLFIPNALNLHCVLPLQNCGQHQWVISSPLLSALWILLEENTTKILLSLSLDLFFKISLLQVTFLIFFSIAIFSPYFLQVGCYCKLIVACILCVIYVREDNDSNV